MRLFKFSLLCLFGLHLYSKCRGSDNSGKWMVISCSRCGCRLTMYEPHEPPRTRANPIEYRPPHPYTHTLYLPEVANACSDSRCTGHVVSSQGCPTYTMHSLVAEDSGKGDYVLDGRLRGVYNETTS